MSYTQDIVNLIDEMVNFTINIQKKIDQESQLYKKNQEVYCKQGIEAKKKEEDIAKKNISSVNIRYQSNTQQLQVKIDMIRLTNDRLERIYPKYKIDFSKITPRSVGYSTQDANEILQKISETGFWAWLKRILTGNTRHTMAAELYQKIDNAIYGLEQQKIDEQKKANTEIQMIKRNYSKKATNIDTLTKQNLVREQNRHLSKNKLLEQEIKNYLRKPIVSNIQKKLNESFIRLDNGSKGWSQFMPSQLPPDEILLGVMRYSCIIAKPTKVQFSVLKRICGYNTKTNGFTIPYTVSNKKPVLVYIESDTNTEYPAEVFRDFVTRQIRFMPMYSYSSIFMDPVNRGRALGTLIHLSSKAKGSGICEYYLNSRDIAENMQKLTQYIDNVCQKLTSVGCRDIYTYNAQVPKNRIPYKTVVIHDFPNGFDTQSLEALKVAITQASQCGVSILISRKKTDKLENNALSLLQNNRSKFINMTYTKQQCIATLTKDNTSKSVNVVYSTLPISNIGNYLQQVNKKYMYAPTINNEFAHYFPIDKMPVKRSALKTMKVPFAIDEKGKLFDFEICDNELNSYGIMTGGVGAGKSSTLHTLITSMALHYSPYELEIWIIDYKLTEFASYKNVMPSHIKYVVINRSAEITYSILEKITFEIRKRAKLFIAVRAKDYEDYRKKTGKYLPKILVIIDEFHVMSQAVTNEPEYKVILSNIIREARSHGVYLLLADQGLNGLRALSEEDKSWFTVRVAMRQTEPQLIKEALQINGSMDEDLNNQIKAVTRGLPGTMLYKYYENIKNTNTLSGDIKYKTLRTLHVTSDVRNRLFKTIKTTYKNFSRKQEFYDEVQRYHFNIQEIQEYESENPRLDEKRFYIGSPLGLGKCKYLSLEDGNGENILLAGNNLEMQYSILVSVLKCAIRYKYHIVLLIPRNAELYRKHHEVFEKLPNAEIITTFPEMCQYIGRQANILKEQFKEDDFYDFSTNSSEKLTFVVAVNASDIYELMEKSSYNQEQAWKYLQEKEQDLQDVTITKEEKNEKIFSEDLKKRQQQRARQKENSDASSDDSVEDYNEKLMKLIQGKLEKLKDDEPSKTDVQHIPDDNMPIASKKITGYNAVKDWGELLQNGYKTNHYSMIMLDSPIKLKRMREIKLEGIFNHRIALSMSPDEASYFMNRTRVMNDINNAGDKTCAIYSNKGGREQCFRPYIV